MNALTAKSLGLLHLGSQVVPEGLDTAVEYADGLPHFLSRPVHRRRQRLHFGRQRLDSRRQRFDLLDQAVDVLEQLRDQGFSYGGGTVHDTRGPGTGRHRH